jgi:hypothetical protein
MENLKKNLKKCLTESEARYLLRAKTIERIRNQLTRSICENNG